MSMLGRKVEVKPHVSIIWEELLAIFANRSPQKFDVKIEQIFKGKKKVGQV